MSAPRCKRKGCLALMVEIFDKSLGRVAFACRNCARTKARLCRDCDARTPSGKHIRCAKHAHAQLNKRQAKNQRDRRRRDPKWRTDVNARRRDEYAASPTKQAAARQQAKDYAIAHPRVYDTITLKFAAQRNRERRANPKINNRINRQRRQKTKRDQQAKLATGLYRLVTVHGTAHDADAVVSRLVRIPGASEARKAS